jgi:hypothetical protein
MTSADEPECFDETRLGPAFDAILDEAIKRDLADHTEELDDAGAFEDDGESQYLQ